MASQAQAGASSAQGSTSVRQRRLAAVSGAVAAGVGLAVGELASSLADPPQSLVGSVGNQVIDRSGEAVTRWAIDVLGTADKPVLIASIVVVCVLLGALVGMASLRRRWIAPLCFLAFGIVGGAAGAADPLSAATVAYVAGTLGGVAGASCLLLLLARIPEPAAADPVGAGGEPVEATAAEMPSAMGGPRRAFFAYVGAAGAFGVLAAAGARALSGRSPAEEARTELTLPAPSTPGPPVPAGLDVAELTPYITPNAEFYRIDTALVVPQVDVDAWRLAIKGMVDQPFEIGFDELLGMPMVEEVVTLSCVSNYVGGNLVGNATWLGVPLRDLLDRAGVQDGATQIMTRSVDDFTAGFPTEVALDGRTALVAVGMNGEPLPVIHGFPARLVVAGLYGYVSATKWVSEIELTTWEAADGYWIPRGWSKEGPIKTQSRIDVPRRSSDVVAGPTAIAGVAWAPTKGIARVEVQVDDGAWEPAELGPVTSDDTWCQWVRTWDATPGRHRIRVRATDGTGATQPEELTSPEPNGATGWHTVDVDVDPA